MNKNLRLMTNEYYTYMNVNPRNKYGGDCVVRAIANALDEKWEDVVKELTEYGIKKGFLVNDEKNFIPWLEKERGAIKMNEPRTNGNKKMSVREFIDSDYNIKYQIVVALVGSHHLTCIKNGKVEDTWDCSNNTMHRYWIIK